MATDVPYWNVLPASKHTHARASQVCFQRPLDVLTGLYDESLGAGEGVVADRIAVELDLAPQAEQPHGQEEHGGGGSRHRADPGSHAVVQHVDNYVQVVVVGHGEGDFALGDLDGWRGRGLVAPIEHEAGGGGDEEQRSERCPEREVVATH